MIEHLEDIQRSEIMQYLAEVFHEEFKFLIGEDIEDSVWVRNHGMNSRAFSKDVLEVSSQSYVTNSDMKDAALIHLSRDSIYHQLPEYFFHPLAISNASMSNREVVEAMKKNRKKEEENIHFFIPFDTEIFRQKLKLTNRHINIFTHQEGKNNFFKISKGIVGSGLELSRLQYYRLFQSLCKSELLKENLPEIEKLFLNVLGMHIQLRYIRKFLKNDTFARLGEGILGFNIGTNGPVLSEQDDVLAIIVMKQSGDFKSFEKNSEIVRKILGFFIFSNRAIEVQYRFGLAQNFVLGENFLGYDTGFVIEEKTEGKQVTTANDFN